MKKTRKTRKARKTTVRVKLTKNQLRAIRWIDETGTGDMCANYFSTTEECNERLAMMQSTLTTEFDNLEKKSDALAAMTRERDKLLETLHELRPRAGFAMNPTMRAVQQASWLLDEYEERGLLKRGVL